MSTVILGGGIIGSSIAYYLSSGQSAEEIHVVECSSQLFSAASGYAAGFLAKDWFAPSLAPLAALSFDLHDELAAENGGTEKWGYMKGSALSMDVPTGGPRNGPRGDDWLRAGTSRADTAAGFKESRIAEAPTWLTKQRGAALEKISDDNTTAVADPLRLSKYLINTAVSRGVKLHHPARAVSVVTDQGTITGVRVVDLNTQNETIIPCTNLIVSAGPWTPQVFQEIFPSSEVSLPIGPLAGYSLVLRSPRYTLEHERGTHAGKSHAIFTTHPDSCGFCPEIFSREGGEIYIAGLNSWDIPLPSHAEGSRDIFDPNEIARLKDVSVRLMGKLADGSVESTDDVPNVDDLEIVREGLCFRPVTNRGTPLVSKVEEHSLGGVKAQGGVYVAAGHGPWGISLSLGTGKVVSEMVQGLRTSADVSGLAV